MTATPPGLWRNLLAMVYDTFLVAPLLMLNGFIQVLAFGPTADATLPTVPAWLIQATSFLVVAGFFSVFWCKSGQTLGMQAWRIKLVSEDGSGVTLRQALLRCVAAVPSIALLGLGYWWALIDPDRLRWHDRLSGTRLELVPSRRER